MPGWTAILLYLFPQPFPLFLFFFNFPCRKMARPMNKGIQGGFPPWQFFLLTVQTNINQNWDNGIYLGYFDLK